MPCLALEVPGENLHALGGELLSIINPAELEGKGGSLSCFSIQVFLDLVWMSMLVSCNTQTDFYKALANEPNQQFVLSVICGESVKDSTWGAHYAAKVVHF